MTAPINFQGYTAAALHDLSAAINVLLYQALGNAVLVEYFASGKSQWRVGDVLYFYDNGRLIVTYPPLSGARKGDK